MKPEALQTEIRRLRLTARRLIHTFGEGSFRTLFHGRGIEFSALREYVPGDDIRQIEWNTTARRGTPYVKTFVEERDLSVILAIDLSSSMDIKMETVSRVIAMLSSLANYHDDRLGCLGFTDKIEFYLPPSKNPTQPERILHLLLKERHEQRKTGIANALGFLHRIIKKHSILFVVSDFLDRNFERQLVSLSSKHEIVGLYVYHPYEALLPAGHVLDCYDPETGRRMLLDGYDTATRREAVAFFEQQKQTISRCFAQSRADLLMLSVTAKADLQLIEFLRRRQNSRTALRVLS